MKNCYLLLVLIITPFSYQSYGQSLKLVEDLAPGSAHGIDWDAEIITTIDDVILFENGASSYNNNKIYISNGETDIVQEVYDSVTISDFVHFTDTILYLVCKDFDRHLIEFNKSTSEVKEVAIDYYSISNPTVFNDKIYFSGIKEWGGDAYLYQYDPQSGSLAAKFKLTNYYYNKDMIEYKNELYLVANYNGEVSLLKFDGEASVPEVIYYLTSIDIGFERGEMTVAGDYLYFWYMDDDMEYHLYRTDGTIEGTIILSSEFRNENPSDSKKNKVSMAFEGKYYFSAALRSGGPNDTDLYVTDGTVEGTKKIALEAVPDLNSKPEYFTIMGNELYVEGRFSGASWYGYYGVLQLNEERNALIPVYEDGHISETYSTYGEELAVFQDSLVFVIGIDGNAKEIWTSEPITKAYNLISASYLNEGLSRPSQLTATKDKLFFFAKHPEYGYELFVYNPKNSVDIKDVIYTHKKVIISPNPVKNRITIDIDQPIEHAIIYNSFGQIIFELEELPDNNLNISILPKGIYYVVIASNGNSYVGRFMKTNL